jgi:hypothetical protein
MPRKPPPPASEPRRGVKGKKVGRPTSYRPAFVKRAFELCLLGAGEERIAEDLGIAQTMATSIPSVQRGLYLRPRGSRRQGGGGALPEGHGL